MLVSIFCLIHSCSRTTTAPPTACISVLASDTVYVNKSVSFTSCASGATAYLWNFGDSTTATTQNAAHTYTNPGTYTVTFTPSNADGPGTPKTLTVYVYAGYYTFKGVTKLVSSVWPHDDGVLFFDVYVAGLDMMLMTPSITVPIQTLPNSAYHVSGDSIPGTTLPNTWYIGLDNYHATGNGTNQIVTVTSTGNSTHGSKNLSGTGIELVNRTNPSDSAPVTFNLTCTY